MTMRQTGLKTDFILFGAGNYNTLGVLHQLGEIGVDPLLLIVGKARDRKHGNLIGYSKFARQIVEVATENEGLEWLLDHKDAFGEQTIVYPTSDTAERLLDSNLDTLCPKFRFPNAGRQGSVTRLMDKKLQTEIALESGLPVIKSQYSNATDFSFDKVEYPCMVKPLNSTEGSKGDMRVCHDEAKLKEALADASETKNFIVQKYIENEADRLFLGMAFSTGEVWIPAVVAKPGVSARGEYTHAVISTDVCRYLPEIDEVKAFVKRLCYRGPFSIEFGHEKGQNYFFEINLRNDGTSCYPLNAGINFAEAYLNDSPSSSQETIEYEMIDEVGDLRRVLGRELSLSEWLRAFRKAGSYRFYHKGDYGLIFPLLQMFISRLTDKIVRMFVK